MHSKSADQSDSHHAIVEDFVVDGDEQRAHVFRLCEMLVEVETFMQRFEYSVSDTGVCSRSAITPPETGRRVIPGSAMATVSSLSITSPMISIEWLLA